MQSLNWPSLEIDSAVAAAGKALATKRVADLLEELDDEPSAIADAKLPHAAACFVFAEWFTSRRDRLEDSAADAAMALLEIVPTRELRVWLALRVMVLAPVALTKKLKLFSAASVKDAAALARALRPMALAQKFDARVACIRWLASVDALEIESDAEALLSAPEKELREIIISVLEDAEPEDRAAASEAITRAALKEKTPALRDKLAALSELAASDDDDDDDDVDDDDDDDVEVAKPAKSGKGAPRFGREQVSVIDRISKRIERLARSPMMRADASRAIQKLGERAIQVVTLVGTAVARDEATLAAGLDMPLEEAEALAAQVEDALRSVMSREDS